MKKLIAVLLIGILILSCSFALAEDDRVISVTASGAVHVAPDTATLYIGVSTAAPTVKEAQEQNARSMSAVLAALKALGVGEGDAPTDNYSVNPTYDYQSDTPKVTGYSVENTLLVTVRELSSVSAVIDGAMAAGANNPYGLTFLSSKQPEAYDQALVAAVAEANRKAELLASAAGMKLGKVVTLTEQADSYIPLYRATASLADNATPIEASAQKVTATVTVTFEIK